jgi:hypothetical protein
LEIDNISLTENGLYSITGGGTVKDTVEILAQSLTLPSPVSTTVVAFTDTTLTNDANSWSGAAGLTLPAGYQHILLIIDNNLQAVSDTGGAAFIDKKSIEIVVSIGAISPEPASLMGLLCGAPLLLLRKRRQNQA